MELLDLELRRSEHWQQREGVAVADVGAKLRSGEPLGGGEARLAAALARQEPVLYVGLSLLLNMAEADVGIEAKMVKKVSRAGVHGSGIFGIANLMPLNACTRLFPHLHKLARTLCGHHPPPAALLLPLQGLLSLLVLLLDRGSPQLLLLGVTFLRRLSLFADNCAPLRQAELVGLLVGLLQLPGSCATSGGGDGDGQKGDVRLLSSILCLLHNLSFDEGMRQQMVEAGLIAKAVELLKAEALDGSSAAGGGSSGGTHGGRSSGTANSSSSGGQGPPLRQLALGLLYHLSLQDRHRSMFLYTGEQMPSECCIAPSPVCGVQLQCNTMAPACQPPQKSASPGPALPALTRRRACRSARHAAVGGPTAARLLPRAGGAAGQPGGQPAHG